MRANTDVEIGIALEAFKKLMVAHAEQLLGAVKQEGRKRR